VAIQAGWGPHPARTPRIDPGFYTDERVADASVLPSIVSANTDATVYAIAERAAELVRTRL
jgi:GMC oxidoreductase